MVEVYKGTIVNPIDPNHCDVILDGVLQIEDGIIQAVGSTDDITIPREAKVTDLGEAVIMPGFVDTHVHLPQYPITSRYGYSLLEWLKKFTFPAEREFTPERAKALSPIFFYDLFRNGTTTAAIYTTTNAESTDVVFEEALAAGIRAVIGKVMMDQNGPDFLIEKREDSIKTSNALCDKWNGTGNGRLSYAYTPRFAPTCSEELMKETAIEAKKRGAYIQTHLSENQGELQWVSKLFPWAFDYTDVYGTMGLLGPKTILAHAIYLSDRELKTLKELGCGIAHCPTSNLFLKSGIMPMGKIEKAEIPIGLGSDVGGGPTLSMPEVMRTAIYSQVALELLKSGEGALPNITPEHVIYQATQGGADVLRMGDKIGSLTPGKKADFIVYDMRKMMPENRETGFLSSNRKNILSTIVFQGNSEAVSKTVVDGRIVYNRPS